LMKQVAQKQIPSDSVGLYTYATMQLIAEAIAKAGTLDTHKVAKVLYSEHFPTVLGDGTFNAKGSFTGPPEQLYQWHNGKIVQAQK